MTRGDIVQRALKERSVLEVGPFCNPVLVGPQVTYFDVMPTEGLVERARKIGYPIIATPRIDFVSPVGDLSVVDRQFDACLSSHCIEHQPDLIGHLQAISRILSAGGAYYLIVPDKRYCFDALISESNLAEVVAAHIEGRTRHSLESVIEHRALTTHNDPIRHWIGDHFDPEYHRGLGERTSSAIAEWRESSGQYIDVHAWQFTPASFRGIISSLREMKYIDLSVDCVGDTPQGQFEFVSILRRA